MALCFPEFAFSYKASLNNITVYSDKEIPDEINDILKNIQLRLEKSTINNKNIRHKVFICNDLNRFLFFTNTNYKVGGINYAYLNRNIFLRPAVIERNRLLMLDGREVPSDRTLTYYMTHEITHGLTVTYVGKYNYKKVPSWIKEGYADYIGKGKIDFKQELEKYKNNDMEMDIRKSGLYLKYHLFVAYLLDIKKTSLNELFSGKDNYHQIEIELMDYQI